MRSSSTEMFGTILISLILNVINLFGIFSYVGLSALLVQ